MFVTLLHAHSIHAFQEDSYMGRGKTNHITLVLPGIYSFSNSLLGARVSAFVIRWRIL